MSLTISELGDLGDFIGGIGVIVTLIYLAVQIRRNTRAVRSASLDSAYTRHMEFQRTIWSDPKLNDLWFRGLFGRDALSDADGRQFFFMLISCVRLWESAYFKSRDGTLEQTAWGGLNREIISVFSYPGVKPYWSVLRTACAEQFVCFVEGEIDELK